MLLADEFSLFFSGARDSDCNICDKNIILILLK